MLLVKLINYLNWNAMGNFNLIVNERKRLFIRHYGYMLKTADVSNSKKIAFTAKHINYSSYNIYQLKQYMHLKRPYT